MGWIKLEGVKKASHNFVRKELRRKSKHVKYKCYDGLGRVGVV